MLGFEKLAIWQVISENIVKSGEKSQERESTKQRVNFQTSTTGANQNSGVPVGQIFPQLAHSRSLCYLHTESIIDWGGEETTV